MTETEDIGAPVIIMIKRTINVGSWKSKPIKVNRMHTETAIPMYIYAAL